MHVGVKTVDVSAGRTFFIGIFVIIFFHGVQYTKTQICN